MMKNTKPNATDVLFKNEKDNSAEITVKPDAKDAEIDILKQELATLKAKDAEIDILKQELATLKEQAKTGSLMEKESKQNAKKSKEKLMAEIDKKGVEITMTPNDAKFCRSESVNVYLARVNGIEYTFKTNEPTKVHPKHKHKIQLMLGQIRQQVIAAPNSEYNKKA